MERIQEQIQAECKKNLECGRAIATGIGVFAALIKMDEKAEEFPRLPQILLRQRPEKDSLFSEDLSGKWEMTGGGVELAHFEDSSSPYQAAILAVLMQELKEETGLVFFATSLPEFFFLIPAWIFNREKGILDLAFVIPIPWKDVKETDEFKQKIEKGEVRFFRSEELGKIEIVCPRIRFLINEAIDYALRCWP